MAWKNKENVIYVSTRKELTELLTCPSCGKPRLKNHKEYLPVPEDHIVGEEFTFVCSSCNITDTVRFFPQSFSDIE